MEAIRHVLVRDAQGQPITRHRLVASSHWDEIRTWSDQVYMPYAVSPLGRARVPDSVLDAAQIGHFTLSRFKYGIPVNICDFSPEAGTGMVLTTLNGSARHWSDKGSFSDTGIGDAFLVDNSRTHYWVDFDDAHLQVNLTFRHDALAALHTRWFGEPADERLWALKFRFGGPGTAWVSLLGYACQCLTELPDAVQHGPLGHHLEEMLGVHLLTTWRQRLLQPEAASAVHQPAPRHVVQAERHIREHARLAPTLSQLAQAAGVSVRTLSQAFRVHRGCTPMQALREARLKGVRAELLLATPNGNTVRDIATAWGYAHLGLFAAAYRQRFGETPSQTLRQAG